MEEPELVERLAMALNPAAFEKISRPNAASEWLTPVYEEFCAAARAQVRTMLAELDRQGLAIVPKKD